MHRIRETFSPIRETRSVVWDDTGFEVREHDRVRARVRWEDVCEIFACKEDRFTFDDICLGFRVRHDSAFHLVGEDFAGYQPFLAQVESRFSGLRVDWFQEVAFPAFAENLIVLWKESPSSTKAIA